MVYITRWLKVAAFCHHPISKNVFLTMKIPNGKTMFVDSGIH